jgi:predicted CXXCH cytochrome family protein
VVHSPLKDGTCLDCHQPHMGAEPELLLKKVPGLCTECHDPAQAALVKSHGGIPILKSNCLGCHEPHVSGKKGLFNDVSHSPFGKGDCIACHER